MTHSSISPSIKYKALSMTGLLVISLASTTQAHADDHIIAGPGAAVVTGYEGSGSYRVLPIPLVDIRHGRFFLNPVDGAGVDIISAGGLEMGASINYVPGYRAKDAPQGVGHLADAAGARLFATYQSNGVRFALGGTKSLGGTDGVTVDATLSYTAKVSPRFTLTPSVATTWANARYDRRYFGITSQQALASGLDTYAPGAGFKDVSTGLTAKYSLNRRWIVALGAYERGVLGDAADSPLVRHTWRPQGTFGVAYMF